MQPMPDKSKYSAPWLNKSGNKSFILTVAAMEKHKKHNGDTFWSTVYATKIQPKLYFQNNFTVVLNMT